MLNEKEVVAFYDTDDVLNKEEELFYKKEGGETEETRKRFSELIVKFANDEADNFCKELKEDPEKWLSRFKYSIQEENGNYWIVAKVANINKLWTILGTEEA